MLNRIFRKKREPDWINRQIVWGIWTPRWLQVGYKSLAHQLNVPISVLVGHILKQWLKKNNDVLHSDIVKRTQFMMYLVDKYLKKIEED